MDRSWGTVRTARGELAVERDALHVHTSPRERLAGELARFRDGGTGGRPRAAGAVLGLTLLPLAVLTRLWSTVGDEVGLSLLLSAVVVCATVGQFWHQYVRDRRIPRTAIESLVLDGEERELTVTHVHDRTPLPTGWAEPYTETIRAPAEEDVRQLRTLLRSTGYDETFGPLSHETRHQYRVETRDGVVFCGACDSQVSPSDDRCPSCDARLRVERVPETA